MRAIGWLFVSLALVLGCDSNTPGGSGNQGGPPDGGSGQGVPPPVQQHALHVRVTGNGDVRASAPAFTCRADCQQAVDATATVHLTAIPDAGWKFDGWQGACTGAGACDLAMSADHDVSAAFSAVPPPPPGSARLSVIFVGSGAGRVISAPAAIDCPGACAAMLPSGTAVSLSAQPDGNSSFAGFGGACSGTACNLTVASDVTAWANFTANAAPPPPPPPPPPPAECSGLTPGAPGPAMSIAAFTNGTCDSGMGDQTGALGLQSFDAPRAGDFLHIVDSNTGVQKAVANYGGAQGSFTPTLDGFIGVFHFLSNPAPAWYPQYWDSRGNFVQSGQGIEGKPVFAGTPIGTVLVAGDFNGQGFAAQHQLWMLESNSTFVRCGGARLASPGAVFGLGADSSGAALIITDGGGGNIDAQWFSNRCVPMTGAFRLISGFQAGPNTWFETAPLIGGGVAVRRVDQQNDPAGRPFRTARWLVVVPAGSASPQPAPRWLTDRPSTSLALARSGRAYALLPMGAPGADCAQKIEVLAPDGVSCGSFDETIAIGACRTEDLALGADGTPIQLLPANLSAPNTCAWRWWPHALR